MKDIIHRIGLGVALAGTTAALLLGLETRADAIPGTPGCVTRAEFKLAKKGMPEERVIRLFGTRGHLYDYRWDDSGWGTAGRSFKGCHGQYIQIRSHRITWSEPLRLSYKTWSN